MGKIMLEVEAREAGSLDDYGIDFLASTFSGVGCVEMIYTA